MSEGTPIEIKTQNRVEKRLKRLEDANFGDYQSVGGGVFELHPYFDQIERTLILLLCGGNKKSQQKDIEIAKSYLIEYKETRR